MKLSNDFNAPCRLTCESLVNPIGLDRLTPRLSWWVNDPREGAMQQAYQVCVSTNATSPIQNPDLWDTGKVDSDQSVNLTYAGKPLTSRQRCYWSVRTWDADGQASPWSEPAIFEIGLLEDQDWQATWIGSDIVGEEGTYMPAPMLRKNFTLEKQPVSARLYVTALGLYDCTINGQPVTDDVLRPGWTDYNHRLIYQVYDVTSQLQQGDNAVGALLGDGWYCGRVGWKYHRLYGKQPQFFAQIEVTFADGSRATIATDDSWTTAQSPIRSNDLLMGEDYDANYEVPDWDQAKFDDKTWQKVQTFVAKKIPLVGIRSEPVRRTQELTAIADPTEIEPGRWIFDLRQNMVGWMRLQLQAEKGQTITIRYAEYLNPNGTMYVENLRGAKATDTYTFANDKPVTYEPRFTFHGFQYVELSGLKVAPPRNAVTGIVVHSDTPVAGTFECSNEMVNQLQSNITWGQRGNFLEVPTDCPQRDERLGWTGDAQAFIRTAAFNMDVSAFFKKWLDDTADAQLESGGIPSVIPNVNVGTHANLGGPAWSDAAVICPWTLYQCYGDTDLIHEHYDMLKRFVDSLHEGSHDFLRCDRRYSKEHCFGDWLNHDATTSDDLIGTAFLAYSTDLFARMLKVIGKDDEAAHYHDLFEKTCQAFCHHFLTPAGRLASQTQTAYLLALYFNLLPETQRQAAANWLAQDIRSRGTHLSTGFVGSVYINHVLSRFGYLDVAYELL
ncbi:MAG: family 78 glycoside hydrolase catalytic domain, partial [Phycisphaeraceae bacterium]|nr:family 78 glycoside hydrolase catalytic domain [Phycisphaeraceae bacterium]